MSEREPTWLERRREKYVADIQRTRRGEQRVPTWVLFLLLVVMVGGWAALIALS